jgi:hypothetical protein
MRLSSKLWVLSILLVLAGMSCRLVTGGNNSEPTPEPYFDSNRGELVFKPETLPDAQKGAAYEVQVIVEQTNTPVGDFSIKEGELPPGLEIKKLEKENILQISGIPQEIGTYTILLDVWCFGTNSPGQTGQKEYTIVVKE